LKIVGVGKLNSSCILKMRDLKRGDLKRMAPLWFP